MQGIDATFDEVSFEGGDGPRRLLLKILPGAAAAALAGAVGVWVLHWCGSAPEGILSHWTSVTAPAPSVSKPFGDIAIDETVLAQLKQPIAPAPSAQVASLETAPAASYAPFPLPALEPFVPAPAPTIPPAGSLPAPPARDLPEIGETEISRSRPPGRPSSPRQRSRLRPSGIGPDPRWRSPGPPHRPTIATFSRSCSDWGPPRLACNRLRCAPHSEPAGRRRAKGEGSHRPRQGTAVPVPESVRPFGPDLRL